MAGAGDGVLHRFRRGGRRLGAESRAPRHLASLGAGTGFLVSYWAGLFLGPRVHDYWPFRNNPQMLQRGHDFFEKWGVASILIGHFFGPLRAVIAIVAGIVRMPALQFHLANWAASFAWGFALLYGPAAWRSS